MIQNNNFFQYFMLLIFLFVPAEVEIYILCPFLGPRRSFCEFPFMLFISSAQSCLLKKCLNVFNLHTKFCLHSCTHDSAHF